MIYENNEQVKRIIKNIMNENNITYDKIAALLDSTKQNVYKILNKNQLKLDDVKKFCDVLGYRFEIGIVKGDRIETDLYNQYINDEFIELMIKLIQLARDVDCDALIERHNELKKQL